MIEAKTMEIEAKTKEIEAKCLSKAEIKELITDDCSKNPCENAKPPTIHVPGQISFLGQTVHRVPNGQPRQNVRRQNGQTRQNSQPRQTAKTANSGFVPRGQPRQTAKRAG